MTAGAAVRERAATDPQALLDAVTARFNLAVRAAGVHECSVAVGQKTLTCRFAGRALDPVFARALRHLVVPTVDRPDATVFIWDSASTGVPMVQAPWSADDYNIRGEVKNWSHPTIVTALNPDGLILSMYDAATATGIVWARDWRTVPYYEQGAPLRFILQWWMRQHGRQLLHAGAIGTSRGAVLLAGRGGSGKSNTALGAFQTSLQYLADDYCGVEVNPSPRVFSIYSTGKTHAADVHRLPFCNRISNPASLSTEKALYYLHESFPERICRDAPVTAILMPHVTSASTTRLRPASAAEALRALAPSTIGQLAYAGAEVTRVISELARRVPCLHLDIAANGAAPAADIETWLRAEGVLA
ncbi:MAG: hypothetical protein U0Q11_15380 [Vicinamibacterales bacterium]